jgi:hypothetical protein
VKVLKMVEECQQKNLLTLAMNATLCHPIAQVLKKVRCIMSTKEFITYLNKCFPPLPNSESAENGGRMLAEEFANSSNECFPLLPDSKSAEEGLFALFLHFSCSEINESVAIQCRECVHLSPHDKSKVR